MAGYAEINRVKASTLLWLFAFCFIVAASFIFQKILLPHLPVLNAGNGLMKNDAETYQHYALLMADQIRSHGWSSWSIWSKTTNMSANVSVLAALYALFSSTNPALILPINAAFQATSACLILRIGQELWVGRVGFLSGLIAATLFTILPSALSWYSQPLKDTYVITGVLLILHAALAALRPALTCRRVGALATQVLIGIVLIAALKPYYLRLMLGAMGIMACIAAGYGWIKKHPKCYWVSLGYILMAMLIAAIFVMVKPFVNQSGMQYADWEGSTLGKQKTWVWEHSKWLPNGLEAYLEIPAKTRVATIRVNEKVGAGSLIDGDIAPQSALEVIAYLPRAMQVAIFAPFPGSLLKDMSLTKYLALGEMAFWYLLSPGIVLALLYRKSLALLITLVVAAYFLAIFGFVMPNIGTLFRYRYVYEVLLMLIAIGGWLGFLQKGRQDDDGIAGKEGGAQFNSETVLVTAPRHSGKRKLFGTAMIVSVLTLVGSLGFFVRDLFMARLFGAGHVMDIFFLGTMLPMFFVSILSIPTGTAITPAYSKVQGNPASAARFVGSVILILTLFLALIAGLLYLLSPSLFSLFHWSYTGEKLTTLNKVMAIYLAVLLFSGWIVIINAVLNADGRTLYPAIAQLVVPVVAFVSMLLFSRSYGIYAVAYGMLAGQFMNFLLVAFAMRGRGIFAGMLAAPLCAVSHVQLREYVFLAAAALSSALLTPTANIIASHLPQGSVAIIGLATKVILLITGVIGIGMNTVLLPYFSNLIARFNHTKAQADLSFFLLFVTLLSVPAVAILTALARPIVHLVFAKSAMSSADLETLVEAIQYGLNQLPFFTSGLVMLKYITAHQRSGIIFWSSLVSIALMFILGEQFAGWMGVAGISLAMTLSVGCSAVILVIYAIYIRHLSPADARFIIFNWGLCVLLFISLNSHRVIEALITMVIYGCLCCVKWRQLSNRLGQVS